MNKKIFALAVFLIFVLSSGCIAESSLKEISNEYFEFHYMELDGWSTAPVPDVEPGPDALGAPGMGKIALALVNTNQSKPSNIIVTYQELNAEAKRDLENKRQETQSKLNSYADIWNVESEVIYKNHRPWTRFMYETTNHKWVLMQTYCGQSLVQITFSALTEQFGESESKLTEILNTFLCKVEIVPTEDYLKDETSSGVLR